MDFAAMKPADLRGLIRKGELTGPTTGMCNGYAQGNLVVLPKALAWDFLLFCQRNPKACPLLEVADAGERTFAQFGKGSDIATDIPRYRVYEHGELTGEYTDVSKFFEERNDLVSFLIGCSFSFESELLEAGIPVRQIEEGVNVPMYNTNIPCTPAGVFSGNMVVSMRPIPYRQVPAAAAITAGMPRVHGMPVQIGEPEAIGIHDLASPGLRRCRDHQPRRNTGVLALRRDPAERCDALQAGVLHHPCTGAHVCDRRKKCGAEILRADSKNRRGAHCAPLRGRSIALCLKVED